MLELWVGLGLAIAGAAAIVGARLYAARRRAPEKDANNIYPLW
jgi:NAD(P)-dependent dehydrogenase (short-subunit alcohol dehydrogenase family)